MDPEGLPSPCLLHLFTGPGQTAHVAHGPVRLGERPEDAEHRIGHHDDQRQGPGGGDDPVGVGTGLPGAGLEGVADGAVALDSDGHQAEGGDTDGYPCGRRGGRREDVRAGSSQYAGD